MQSSQEKLVQNLIKYDEIFVNHKDHVIIKTHSPLISQVNFENDGIQIQTELSGWNLITGIITMKFEKVLNYLLVMSLLFVIILCISVFIQPRNDISLVSVFLPTITIFFVLVLNVIIYLNYRIKYEHIKDRIIHWTS